MEFEGRWWLSGKQKTRKGRRDYEQESLGTKQPSACGWGDAIILVNCYFSLLLFAVVFTIFRRDQDRRRTHLAVASELVAEHGEAPQAGWKWLERKKG